MKKSIFVLLFLFIFIPNLKAYTFSLGEKVPDMHIESVLGDNVHNGIPFILRRDDNEFVYCLNPFQQLNTIDNYIEYSTNNKIFNLSDEQLNKMNLISYYGYNYYNHKELKWYGITQFLIWKTLNLDDIYFTDTKDGNKIIAYESEIKELETLVNDHSKLPSFANKSFEYSINSNNELIDTNNVLSNYEIKSTDIDIKINNNKLNINTTKEGIYKITFVKKSPITRDYKLYYLKDYQSLLYPGKVNDITFTLTIEVSSGRLLITKFDSEGKIRREATLENTEYGIYKNQKLIYKINTDKNGKAIIKGLPYGKYVVSELTPSKGYKKDINSYQFTINQNNKDVLLKTYSDVIKGTYNITKYYVKNNVYKYEDGAIFEIYDVNNNKVGEYKTTNGKMKIELEYGKYKLVQKEGIEGYKFSTDKTLKVEEEKDYILNLYNEVIKGKLKINKYYGSENNYKLEDNAIFEIYDIDNNKAGEYETKNGVIEVDLAYGEYKIVQIKGIEGYKFIDKINLEILEEKEYKLDLYDEKDFIVVDVPNTKKNNYNKLLSLILIIMGIFIIFISKRTTDCQ